MRMDRLRTCGTPQDPSDWIKASVMWTSFGRFCRYFKNWFRPFLVEMARMLRYFWFTETKLVDWRFEKEIRWLNNYLKPQMLQKIANHEP